MTKARASVPLSVPSVHLPVLTSILIAWAVSAFAQTTTGGVLSVRDVFTSSSAAASHTGAAIQPAAAGLSREAAVVLLDDARALLRAGNATEARAVLLDIERRRPGDEALAREIEWLRLATAADANEALGLFRAYSPHAGRDEHTAEAARLALRWATRAAESKENASALMLLEIASDLAKASQSSDAMQAVAEARVRGHLADGNPALALERLQATEEEGGAPAKESASWLALKGDCAFAAGRFDVARDAYRALAGKPLPADGSCDAALARLGLMAELDGDGEQALAWYERYLARNARAEDRPWVALRARALAHPLFPPPPGRSARVR